MIFYQKFVNDSFYLFLPVHVHFNNIPHYLTESVSLLNGSEQVGLAVTLQAYRQETPVYILSRLIGQTEVCRHQSLHAIAEIIP